MNLPCNVIVDLIPLVKDGVASNESTEIVNKHVSSCESCKAELETFGYLIEEQLPINDDNIINAIKGRIYFTQMVVLVVGAIIGIALSNSMGMFYNFIIMPIIGGISLITFKRKWYIAPVAIFILTYLWQTIAGIVADGFSWIGLYFGSYYSVIYTVLVVLGVIITALLKYAFKKGE